MKNSKVQPGFAAITSVLVISFVVIALASTVSFLAIGEGQASLGVVKGEETLALIESCMETALNNARTNANYTGGTITLPEGACTLNIAKVGTVWTLTATNTDNKYQRSIQVVMTRNPTSISLTSWKEI